LGAHTKSDLKVHLVWIPKYRKAVLTGEVAIRVRDLLRQIAAEHELEIMSGKVARDHVHLFVSYRPNQQVSQIMQWLKGISSRVLLQEFPHLRKQFWGRHFWARGYLAVSSGTITDEMIREYIDEQEGEQVADDSNRQPLNPSAYSRGSFSKEQADEDIAVPNSLVVVVLLARLGDGIKKVFPADDFQIDPFPAELVILLAEVQLEIVGSSANSKEEARKMRISRGEAATGSGEVAPGASFAQPGSLSSFMPSNSSSTSTNS
jgi:REP-associated tyrosine transposase